jgi:hypothetical protein
MGRLGGLILAVLMLVVASLGSETQVLSTPLTKKVNDYYVSIGVMNIQELKKGFPRAYKLLVKHHGEPGARDTHHLAVSIWKQDNGEFKYISDFTVEAEVRSQLIRAVRKRLDKYPHQYGDNFGAWFDMSDKGLYHITVIIHEDGKSKKVDFDYLIQ